MSETREDCVSPEQSPAAKELGKLRAAFNILQSTIEKLSQPLPEDYPLLIELRNLYRRTCAHMERPIRYGLRAQDLDHSISFDERREFDALAKEIAALIAACEPALARKQEARSFLKSLFSLGTTTPDQTILHVEDLSAHSSTFSVIRHPALAVQAVNAVRQKIKPE